MSAERKRATRYQAALPDGPLQGVPFVIKDLGMDVAGLPSTNGSRLFADAVAEKDSTLVERYRQAGLVVIGKTNTPGVRQEREYRTCAVRTHP